MDETKRLRQLKQGNSRARETCPAQVHERWRRMLSACGFQLAGAILTDQR
jgi:hypothetical protein